MFYLKKKANAKLFQIKELLPEEILKKVRAPPKAQDVPVIQVNQLTDADGFLFGLPTRSTNFNHFVAEKLRYFYN